MLKIEDVLSESELIKYNQIEAKLASGEIKRATLPNTEEEFSSEEALINFKAFLATGITKKHMEQMDDQL
jgi:hypothetical protein